jgi:DNA methyltransferase 1-associated protein 1
MSSSDVRDLLNLPDGSGGRPSKKQKLSAPRPNLKGLAREVHNLGGDNPIAIVPAVTHFKKRRLANRKPAARWELSQFRNSARDGDDTLILRHWKRREDKATASGNANGDGDVSKDAQDESGDAGTAETTEAGEEMEDSPFAKYNVRVTVPQYTDDQYQSALKSDHWSKEETDYLMELTREFDLRWPVIWDRYEWNPPATNGVADDDGDEGKAIVPAVRDRTMEDLKARYYDVAAKMMALQKPVQYMSQPEFALHELMAHFNPQQEKLRKEFATKALTRPPDEAREEESLLLEIKRILARSERFNEERRELYSRLDYPRTETDISSFKSSAGLQSLLQSLMTADKTKKRRSLMGPEAANPASAAAAVQQAAAAQEASRRESTAASTGPRESTAAPTPATSNKKGAAQQQPAERPKLTEKEEAIYGVTHHDRLGSGPTFRTEKINKLFSHKSNQQQLRINNTLNELDIPIKLAMATAASVAQYELLLGAVNSLLDARKVSDKLDGEIKIELAKKEEWEKANAASKPANAAETQEADQGDAAKGEEKATATSTEGTKSSEDAAADSKAEKPPTSAGANQSTDSAAGKNDEDADAEKDARPGSSGNAHKRSASVLSTVSDKSNKRQKK